MKKPNLNAAIHTIARKCGPSASRFLSSPRCPLTQKQILTISRMAPPRQRYELRQVANGKRLFQKPMRGVPPLDTQSYSEIPSRIGRAWGHVNKVAMGLQRLRWKSPVEFKRTSVPMELVNDVIVNSDALLRLMDALKPEGNSKPAKKVPTAPKRFNPSQITTALASANGLIAKNVRDIPRMPRRVRPTCQQANYIQSKLREIINCCESIKKMLPTVATSKAVASPNVKIVGGDCQAGTYVLRIAVRRDQQIAFGRFKGGKRIHLPAGEYCYVGSALKESGATCLARRLLRHASRTIGAPHKIRREMATQFCQDGLEPCQAGVVGSKVLHWHVDFLLDRADVELICVYCIRSKLRLERCIGQMLESDPRATVIERGLGATDVAGNTHVLRIDADEPWWNSLPLKLVVLAMVGRRSAG